VKAWPLLGITLMQILLLLAHWFLFRVWIDFWPGMPWGVMLPLRDAMFLLAPGFIAAALLGFYYENAFVRIFYRIEALWLGFFNFFFWAACLCRLLELFFRLTPWFAAFQERRLAIAAVLFTMATLVGLWGVVNARWIRIRRLTLKLPGLPESWRGRTALLFSDVHLGNVLDDDFSRRLSRIAARLEPSIVFIPGDIFDGAKASPDWLIAPLRDIHTPLGIYFAAGNHDEFGGEEHFSAPLERADFHVLHNRREVVDGLQIVGVTYGESTHPLQMHTFLEGLKLKDGAASILLNHVPNRLPIAEAAGVTLQLSGHTHGGQIFPFTWITRRAFGRFTYGLQRYGSMQVYTSTGCGSWGPPMRVGAAPEVVFFTFA